MAEFPPWVITLGSAACRRLGALSYLVHILASKEETGLVAAALWALLQLAAEDTANQKVHPYELWFTLLLRQPSEREDDILFGHDLARLQDSRATEESKRTNTAVRKQHILVFSKCTFPVGTSMQRLW